VPLHSNDQIASYSDNDNGDLGGTDRTTRPGLSSGFWNRAPRRWRCTYLVGTLQRRNGRPHRRSPRGRGSFRD